jgi:two-component system, cell cycle response regulator DivK
MKRILVIEDNPMNLELVTDLLEASGFSVAHARTAEEGLRLARESLPDLILMDISLPGMDGLAATRALRADAATRQLVIIALTAHAMKGDEESALEAGCDAYLAKPINTRTFIPRLTGLMTSASAGGARETL